MNDFNFPKIEEHILKFWKEKKIFEKSLKKGKGKKRFVFFDGPPTANGRPGIHHILSRAFKDVFCRYKTMQGFLVERKAGWDTHGLPVELEVEKKLGIKSKPEIEKYGIAPFNKKCKESVWEYKDEWEKMTERTAYWVDTKNPYITYDNNYIESLWWIIGEISKKNLLYKGHKIVPYCARCGTAISSHEVAQGYKKVKDPSIYVKFKIRNIGSHSERSEESQRSFASPPASGSAQDDDRDVHFLVWTTTPWTLPANTALAVGPDIDYVQIRAAKNYDPSQSGEPDFDTADTLILAKARLGVIKGPYHIEKEFKGKDLIGLEYEPMYAFGNEVCELEKATLEKPCCFLVVPADFVSTEDGTGIVHIAPAFGEDDMQTAQKQGLNTLITVDEEGKFKKEITPWAGMFVKDADPLIIEDLKNKNILYKSEKYEHDYPFCWRCRTPLIYYAKKTWFVKMSQLKDKLISANKKVNWVPSHLRDGRFGEWLKDMKDWAFSRERYWGTPLPIWICRDCGDQKIVSGISDLSKNQVPKNKYFFMRHAEAEHNCKKIVSCWPETKGFKLTKKGKGQIKKSAAKLIKELQKNGESNQIDVIFASDLRRTKETAEEMAKILGVKKIIFDSRLREVKFGDFNEKTVKEYHAFFKTQKDKFDSHPPKGESWNDVKERMFEFLRKIDERMENKNILVVSHGDPLWLLDGATKNLDYGRQLKLKYPKVGEWWEVRYATMPMDEKGRIDLHRPYIDKIELKCKKCKGVMKRTPEVADVWFDSGAMPFAQWHWPFENKARINRKMSFPADFIAEGIDQTRGWFYTLLAVSTALDKGAPYKNVISNGHVLDKSGQKMSKSKGNVVNPWEMLDKYGSDVIRWYFYTVNPVGESKLFDEKDLQDRQRNFVMTIINTLNFYQLYAGKNSGLKVKSKKLKVGSDNVLDKWVLAKLNVLVDEVNKSLDAFDATTASRAIVDFVDDLSNWYVRRSRARFRDEESEDYKSASATLRHVLIVLSKLIAPFTPFLAEYVFHNLEGHEGSVHLENYPTPSFSVIPARRLADKTPAGIQLIEQMALVRKVVAMGLKLRAQNQLKVRQPIAALRIKNQNNKTTKQQEIELINLIKDELNVKDILLIDNMKEEAGWKIAEEGELKIALDTRLTDELRMEGAMRDIVRNIQEMRKDAKLTPNDMISLYYDGGADILRIFDKFSKEIKETVLAEKLYGGHKENETFKIEREFEIEIGGKKEKAWIGIKIA